MSIQNDLLVDALFPAHQRTKMMMKARKAVVPKYTERTVSGNPAVLTNTTAGLPLTGLKLCGKSTQESTTGAQLLPLIDREPETLGGLTWQTKDGTVSVNGICTEADASCDYYFVGAYKKYEDAGFPVGNIAIAVYGLPQNMNLYVVDNSNAVICQLNANSNFSMLNHKSEVKYRIMLRGVIGKSYDVQLIKIMFNIGTTALPWEPYTGGQPSPSPDYPQQIVSTGDSGSINVNVFEEKNMFDYKAFYAGYKTIQGSSIGRMPIKVKPNTKYIVSSNIDREGLYSTVFCVSGNDINFQPLTSNNGILSNAPRVVTSDTDGYITIGIYVLGDNAISIEDFKTSVWVRISEDNAQTLILLTPNGLPGIPVTSGGNCVDSSGKRWIADYVDLKRGKYVQNVQKAHVPNNVKWTMQKQSNGYALGYFRMYADGKSTQSSGMSDSWKSNIGKSSSNWSNGFSFGKSTVFWIVPYENDGTITSEDINAWLTEHPMDIIYPLETPIEHDLTQEEIETYKALVTYDGTTIVETQEDVPYMEVGYKIPVPKPSSNEVLGRWFKQHPLI